MRTILLLISLALACLPAGAQTANEKGIDPTEIALESLFTMEVTTASKFPEKLSEAPGVMSVVTQDEMRRFGAVTVREVLERVPGLIATTGYFGDRSMVAVRGDQVKENGSHVLLLINGRPVREIHEGGVISDLLQSFPVNILERIEVIRGPGSVLYGTNAFSGVINLITKRPVQGTSATFRTNAVQRGSAGASGELLFERGKLNIVAAGQMRVDPARRVSYRFDENDFVLGGRNPLQQAYLRDVGPGAYLGVDYKGLHFMGGYTDWQAPYFVRGTVGENHWKRGFTNLGYTLAPTANWQMDFNVTHTLTRLASSDFPSISRASSDTVVEWTNVVRATSRDQITFGTLYNYIESDELYHGITPAVSISQGTRHSPGFYAQIEHRLGETWKAIGGLQSNKIGALELATVPRLGVIWSPSAHVHVKALYGKAFRAPSINEMRLDHPGLQGNPNLESESVGTFDLGVSYQSNRFLGAVNFYDSRQRGIILPSMTIGRPQYRNLGVLEGRGVELEGKRYFSDELFVHGSLLYNSQSNPTIPTPRWTVAGGISYQDKRSFTVSLFDVYHSTTPQLRVSLNPVTAPYQMLHGHTRFELARVFGESAKPFALFVHGVNLANSKVWLPDWGSSVGETIPFSRGRTLYYGLEVALFRE